MVQNNTDAGQTTDMSTTVTNYSIEPSDDTGDTTYTTEWTRWLGFYTTVPDLQSSIDKKAIWTVGNGYKADKRTTNILKNIKGNGKETFNTILQNAVRVYTIGGDFYAEIIKKGTKLINLKALNPGRIEIVANDRGIIKKYIQKSSIQGAKETTFNAEDIFHLPFNKLGDDIHGIGTISKLTNDNDTGVLEMQEEAMQDLKTVFHRYVKPLLITEIDEDDEAEISKFKKKLDLAVENGENMVIPKDTANVERVSIPQFSTLDPLPWLNHLDKLIIKAEGVPGVILGDATGTTEAAAKILYLAFEQMVKFNQLFIEEQVESQLGLKINLEFPASLDEQSTQTDSQIDAPKVETPIESTKKARKASNMELKP